MKTTSFVVVAALFAFMGVSQAEEGKKPAKKGPSPEILEKYDTDKDGKLSKEERAVMRKDKADKAAKKPKDDKKPKKEKDTESAE